MDKLLPCPFCGGEADCNKNGVVDHDGNPVWWVECCECRANIEGNENSEQSAANAWNRRAQQENRPPTNAARIRGMDDKALAEYIFELGNYAEYCYDHCAYSGDSILCKEHSNNGRNHEGCLRGVIDWLRQPVKEEV